METRFGVKDFFLFALVILLIIVVLLAMKQYDRQYALVEQINQQSSDQFKEVLAIKRRLDSGMSFGNPTTQQANVEGADPFPGLRKLRSEGKYDQGDWFVMNLPALIEKLTPLTAVSLYSQYIDLRVVEALAYPDPDTFEWKPLLASGWQISPDGLSITFQIRHGVTFSDGSPMTADDVVYSYELGTNPNIDAPAYRQQFDRCQSCTKINDYEVVFKFKQPYYASFSSVGGSLFIVPKNFYSKYTVDQFNNSVGLLMGTGPYKMPDPTSWKPNPGKIELLRNDRYWGLPPPFDRLVFYQIQDDNTQLVNFTNGDQDYISLLPPQYRDLLNSPNVLQRTNHYAYDSIYSGYIFTAWNQRRDNQPTIFADKRVRQAMTMLTNRRGFCDSILLGYATPAPGPYAAFSNQHDPTLQDWKYDPSAAKALLKDAGFEDRGHGVLEKSDGTRLSFKLTYPAKSLTIDRIMRYIKDDYANAGVDMQLDPLDFSILLQRQKTRKL